MVYIATWIVRTIAQVLFVISSAFINALEKFIDLDMVEFLNLFGEGHITHLYNNIFIPFALTIAIAITCYNLLRSILPSTLTGDEESPINLAVRLAGAIIAVKCSLLIVRMVNGMFEPLYRAITSMTYSAREPLVQNGWEIMVPAVELTAAIFGGPVTWIADGVLGAVMLVVNLALCLPFFIGVFKMVKLIGFRYVEKCITEIVAPLPMATIASRKTSSIFGAWLRMYIGNLITLIMSFFLVRIYLYAVTVYMKDLTGMTHATAETVGGLLANWLILMGMIPFFSYIEQYISRLGLLAVGNMRAEVGMERGGGFGKFLAGAMYGKGRTADNNGAGGIGDDFNKLKGNSAVAEAVKGSKLMSGLSSIMPTKAKVAGSAMKSGVSAAMQTGGGPVAKGVAAAYGAVKGSVEKANEMNKGATKEAMKNSPSAFERDMASMIFSGDTKDDPRVSTGSFTGSSDIEKKHGASTDAPNGALSNAPKDASTDTQKGAAQDSPAKAFDAASRPVSGLSVATKIKEAKTNSQVAATSIREAFNTGGQGNTVDGHGNGAGIVNTTNPRGDSDRGISYLDEDGNIQSAGSMRMGIMATEDGKVFAIANNEGFSASELASKATVGDMMKLENAGIQVGEDGSQRLVDMSKPGNSEARPVAGFSIGNERFNFGNQMDKDYPKGNADKPVGQETYDNISNAVAGRLYRGAGMEKQDGKNVFNAEKAESRYGKVSTDNGRTNYFAAVFTNNKGAGKASSVPTKADANEQIGNSRGKSKNIS